MFLWRNKININTFLCKVSVLAPFAYALTHFSLETPKRVIGKQCRPISDITECGVQSGSPLFANRLAIFLLALVAQSDAHPTGDQEVMGSIPIGSGNFLGD